MKVWDEHNEPSKSKTVTLIPLWPENHYKLCALFIFHFLVDDFFREIAVDWLNLCTISVTFWRFAIFFTVSGHRPHQHTCQYEKKLLAKEFWLIVCTYTNILLFNGYNNLHEHFCWYFDTKVIVKDMVSIAVQLALNTWNGYFLQKNFAVRFFAYN